MHLESAQNPQSAHLKIEKSVPCAVSDLMSPETLTRLIKMGCSDESEVLSRDGQW